MEQLVFIVAAISGITVSVVNIGAQNAKRTVNKWAKEILDTGQVRSRETSEIGIIYSSPFSDWFLEIDTDNRIRILRNQKIREKIREYKNYRKLRDRLLLIFLPLLALSFYMFMMN